MNTEEKNWNGLPVTIVGLGRSAVGAARLLARHGALPFVTDQAHGPQLSPWCAELDAAGIPYETGGHTDRAWAAPALAVVSPGVPPAIAPLEALRARGIEVIGELELAYRFVTAPILAVTGTNGKTTVTELLRYLLNALGCKVCLAGNNHTSFSSAVCDQSTPDYYVLEVSSYQLETAPTFNPWIGAVLNVTPDHLGRHGTMETYAEVKGRIFGQSAAHAVLNRDDVRVHNLAIPTDTERHSFSARTPVERGVYVSEKSVWVDGHEASGIRSSLPGLHNRENIAAALAMLHAGGFDLGRCLAALPGFPGVEHRIECLGETAGRRWYNDSKSTNIDSLRVALESFENPVTLIAGGQGKGASYTGLVPLVVRRVRHLIAYGAEGPVLEEAFGGSVPVTVVRDMGEAVERAHALCPPGEVVLLSPGCASFDLYTDFEARGTHFKTLVAALDHEESEQ